MTKEVKHWLLDFPKFKYVIENTGKDYETPHILAKDYSLEYINNNHNAYRYIPEIKDYWKPPPEFYKDGGGDCEDFSVAKYYTCLRSGIKEDKLFIMVGKLANDNLHSMLQVELENNKKIWLDNINKDMLDIDYKYFTPTFYINRLGFIRHEDFLLSHTKN